jgi:S-DNA-T family DNA segregation ATPase FtsK/SpoIIIE
MTARRPWRLDAAACALLAAGLLVSVAVFSLDPADRPGAVYPPTPGSRNVLGPAGAWLAFALTDALGVAVYVLLASWFVLVVLLFLRRSWLRWSLRLAGWLLLVPGAAVLAELVGSNRDGPTPAGPGGSLGAWLVLWTQTRLLPIGRILLLAAWLSAGIALAFDRVVRKALILFGRLFGGVFGSAYRRLLRHLSLLRISRAPNTRNPRVIEKTQAAKTAESKESVEGKTEAEGTASGRTIPIFHHAAPQLADPSVLSERQRFADFELPPITLLEDSPPVPHGARDQQLRDRAALLEKTFSDFGLSVRVVGINTGPVITQFEVALQTGLRVHKVTRLTDDIALNLSVPSVRILAPIPGKNTVGIEIPNENRANVHLKDVILASTAKLAKFRLPLFLGSDGEGRPLVYDLADMPHLLIAGSTGTGKSVCVNAIVLSMLMTRRPDDLKMIMIDPKVVELSGYGKIPHLMHPVVSDMKKAEAILAWAVDKMEERYALLSRARVKNIASFNELGAEEVLRRIEPTAEERDRLQTRLPYVVIFIDEMADLMMMLKKEVEGHIIRLAQKSRAAGIHLVVATQKPTVDVITGLIKSNLPARICFKVTNKSDSRVVLDEMGADKLLGKGDMLFLPPGTSNLVRAQGSYASDVEIQAVVTHLECEPCYDPELMTLEASGRSAGDLAERVRSRDELYETAIEVILREGRGSVSLLQRILQIGYGRAARLIDYMAEDGIVGGYNGSNAREVLYTPDQWAELKRGVRPE